jgi:hypothetical protein
MPLYTYNPTANETPDATLGGVAVTSPTNTGHASTSASASGAGAAQTKSCRWFTFPAFTGQVKTMTLKITHSSDGSVIGPTAGNLLFIDYSLNNGSSWVNAVSRSGFTGAQGPTTFSVALSATQNTTQVQVRDDLFAESDDVGDSAEATATVSDIKLEIETVDGGLLVMM